MKINFPILKLCIALISGDIMQPARFVAIALGIASPVFSQPVDAQTFNIPVSIAANVGGGASASNLAMLMTGNGSGTNGASTAQYGQNLSCAKTNWKTATTVGEIDCLNIGLHQGGPGSDGSGMLINVQNSGLGNVIDMEMQASSLNVLHNTVPLMTDLQFGVINSSKQMYGAIINAVDGAGSAALYVNAQGSATWATVLQAAKLGRIYFKVDSSGNITTDGKVSTASLTTSGSIQAMAGVVTTLPASYIIGRVNCGTTLRSTDASPVALVVPSGLPIGCHVNVIQASDATITFQARGLSGEHVGTFDRRDFQTQGRFAEAELMIDSTHTFLLRGDVGPLHKQATDVAADMHVPGQRMRLASLR